jgi:hypothetical protein
MRALLGKARVVDDPCLDRPGAARSRVAGNEGSVRTLTDNSLHELHELSHNERFYLSLWTVIRSSGGEIMLKTINALAQGAGRFSAGPQIALF